MASLTGCGHAPAAATVQAKEPAEQKDSVQQKEKEAEPKEKETEASVVVRVAPAQRRALEEKVRALGRCQAPPEKLAKLAALVEGRVDKILAKPGQHVKAGQPVVQFDTTLAAADMAEKSAARDSLLATLNVLLAPPREEELQAARLAIEQAKIAEKRASATVDQLRSLRARGDASAPQLFDAEQTLADAQVQLKAADSRLALLQLAPRAQAVAEAQSKITEAERALASSTAKCNLLTIRAPIEGELDSLNCNPGQTLSVGTILGEVVDARHLMATIWISAGTAHRIQAGQAATVSPTGLSMAASAVTGIAGHVVSVGRVADPQTGNVPVVIELPDPGGVLTVGQVVEGAVTVKKHEPLLAVPRAAIQDEGEGPLLVVVRLGKTAVLHPQLGLAADDWVAVAGTDLKEQEPVVIEGGYHLPEGTLVRIDTPAPAEAAKP
ncbi:MAG: efflux RND transporter periplasmic adaptor subunit [Planctomycetia bacterium]|nr:efflux RND transporter periplasmic adaptor subunit [Planctomycetia bacterium]